MSTAVAPASRQSASSGRRSVATSSGARRVRSNEKTPAGDAPTAGDEASANYHHHQSLAPRILLHVAALAAFHYAFASLHVLPELTGIDIDSMYGGHYQFLTVCSLKVSQLAMMAALACDFFPTLPVLAPLKAHLCSVALPFEGLVAILYWSLRFTHPQMIIPPRRVVPDPARPDEVLLETIVMPLWPDVSMHAAPFVFLILDYLLFCGALPRNYLLQLGPPVVAYSIWCDVVKRENGVFPYPLLGIMPTPLRYALYGFCGVLAFSTRLGVDALHARLRRRRSSRTE